MWTGPLPVKSSVAVPSGRIVMDTQTGVPSSMASVKRRVMSVCSHGTPLLVRWDACSRRTRQRSAVATGRGRGGEEAREGGAHLGFGGVLEVGGVSGDGGEAVAGDKCVEQGRAGGVGGHLGVQVSEVFVRGTRGVGAGEKEGAQSGVAGGGCVGAVTERADQDAFLRERAGIRRQGTGRDAADLCVVRAAGGEKAGARKSVGENGRDDRHVRQVAASTKGVVRDVHLARTQVGHVGAQAAHTFFHRAEVDGDVRSVGDEAAIGVEQGAGKIEAFLDVRGEGRAAKGDAHLLGDGGEAAVEEFEFDGVHVWIVGQPARLPCDRARIVICTRAGGLGIVVP